MAVRWTDEQLEVINVRDADVLVSAAAGSGKTAVLVERVLSRITDPVHPVDIDRLLIVTFTNAAASEMRERIRDRLQEKLQEEPENTQLVRQSILINRASIMTIHSFCLQVLRSHFHVIGLDPAFRVADEGEMRLLEKDTVAKLLQQEYEEGRESFLALAEALVTGTRDEALEDVILQIFRTSRGYPWPDEWLRQCADAYENGTEFWEPALLQDVRLQVEGLIRQTENALLLAESPGGPWPYADTLNNDIEILRSLEGGTWEEMMAAFQGREPFGKLNPVRDKTVDAELKDAAKDLRDGVKDGVARLEKQYFYDTPEAIRGECASSGLFVQELVRLTVRFGELLAEAKKERNVLDFSDMEHLTLEILYEDGENGKQPGAAAADYRRHFLEIYTDEYQDSNLVQERILDAVSGSSAGIRNRFMVGDVKQSIYRFRLARPELFQEKYRTYGTKPGDGQRRLDLHRNFRSRPEVLKVVNDVFRCIMTKSLGEIPYDSDAALYPGAEFPPVPGESAGLYQPGACSKQELHMLWGGKPGEEMENEARFVGRRILELAGTLPVWDKDRKAYRPARFGDIVILLRTGAGWTETFRDVLTEMGVPCWTDSRTGYFSAQEVRNVLCCLQILDNPMQDIPLAAVLKSPMADLSDELLAEVRIRFPEGPFWKACRESAALPGFEQLKHFFDWLDGLRGKVPYTQVHDLIWEILEETGYHTYVLAQPAGQVRRANLDMLMEKAAAYEKTSYRGLHHFLRYIEGLKSYEVDYGEASVHGETDDAVRLMTIHKSKGLEFPVVFLCGLQKNFNEQDTRGKAVMHADLGIGCDCVDTEQRLRSPSLPKRVIAARIRRDSLGEELRVLYVAMTRAREKLIMTGTASEKQAERFGRFSGSHIIAGEQEEEAAYFELLKAHSYLDWILTALEHGVCSFLSVLHDLDRPEQEQKTENETTAGLSAEKAEAVPEGREPSAGEIEGIFAAHYPMEKARGIRGKLSVSELKKKAMQSIPDEDGHPVYEEAPVIPLLPGFAQQEVSISPADRGTAYHALMQNLDLQQDLSPSNLQKQLEDLEKCGKISPGEAGAIDLEKIRKLLESPLGQELISSDREHGLFREQPFVLGIPASEADPSWPEEETVLVQGIIDAFVLQEDGSILLIDYKTDVIKNADILVKRYRAQLVYYAQALERLMHRPVTRKLLYSFHLNQTIDIEERT